MISPRGQPHQIVVFAADLWEHVCPTIRILEPASQANLQVIKGCVWENGALQVYPNLIANSDLIIIQRDFPRYVNEYEAVVSFAKKLRKPIVYELDDLLIELASNHPDEGNYLVTKPSILRAILEADAVTASTTPLCQYLRTFNHNVWLLPNFLIDRFWKLKPPKEIKPDNSTVIIGYMGGNSHLPDLEMIYSVLERILERYGQRVSLKFWGLKPSEDLMRRSNVSWTHPYLVAYDAFAQYFLQQDCDIFISPLQDNLFNHCKSGLKYLEYSALGVPGVYSNLPPYSDLITQGLNGILAATSEEWEEGLVNLIEHVDNRFQMASEAQKTINQKWLLSQNSYRWSDSYNQILAGLGLDKDSFKIRSEQTVQLMQKWYIDLAQRNEVNRGQAKEWQAKASDAQTQTTKLKERVYQLEKKTEIDELNANRLLAKKESLEKENEHLQTSLHKKEGELRVVASELAEIRNSITWKAFQRIVQFLGPPHSRRGKILRKMITALRIFRSRGSKGVIFVIKERLKKNPSLPAENVSSVQLSSTVTVLPIEGDLCSLPAISILQIIPGKEFSLDKQIILDWLQHQTWSGWELIGWNQSDGKAWETEHPEKVVAANRIEDLIDILQGKYLCIASWDLIKQDETYLETNLMALESEDLAFTLNINGKADWVKYHIQKGLLPGTSADPLQRMIINKRSLAEKLTLDISPWLINHSNEPIILGKVINHTTNKMEFEGYLEFNNPIGNALIKIFDHSFVALPINEETLRPVSQTIHPIDTVLPSIEMPSEKPTVMIFMPFLAVGGAERVALDMISCLRDEIRFVVIASDEHDPVIGITVDAFRNLTPFVYTSHDFLNSHLNFSLVNYLIERYRPCTFYIANGSPWIYDALSTIKQFHPGLRLVNQVYDHQAGWINRYDSTLAKILDANIGVNQNIWDAFIEKGVPQESIHLIENGVNTFEFDPGLYDLERKNSLKRKFNIKPEEKVVVFMARLHPQKRPMDFVEVARRFKDYPDIRFLMVGDGPLGKTVDEEISRIGITNLNHVSFYQPSSDVYAICDVFVLPSEYEGMPMVVLEAQSMGKPVVVIDVGNNRKVLEMTQGGVIINKIGDISSIRQAIFNMLENPPDPQKVRQAIMDYFSLKIMGDKYRSALLGR